MAKVYKNPEMESIGTYSEMSNKSRKQKKNTYAHPLFRQTHNLSLFVSRTGRESKILYTIFLLAEKFIGKIFQWLICCKHYKMISYMFIKLVLLTR